MKKDKEENKKPEIPLWLLTDAMSLDDIIDIISENSTSTPRVVKEAMIEFQRVLYKKLKDGYSVKSSFGTFYPHFGELDAITGQREFSVEFVPTEEMLRKIEARKMKRLERISLN